jgi:hypothetical protein
VDLLQLGDNLGAHIRFLVLCIPSYRPYARHRPQGEGRLAPGGWAGCR